MTDPSNGGASGQTVVDVGAAMEPGAARHRVVPILLDVLERYVVVVALVALIIVFAVLLPETFPTASNLQSVLTTQSVLLASALGLTVALAAGDLDLSIGGMIGFVAILVAVLTGELGLSWLAALAISFVLAMAVGLFNGFLIVGIGVNALIITLAMGTVLAGAGAALSASQTLSLPDSTLTQLIQGTWLNIGLPFWFSLLTVVALWYLLHQTPAGRALYFTGEGIDAARLVGVRVTRVRVLGLLASAAGAWLAGVTLVGQTGAAVSGIGDAYVLPAYAAAFLGAATIVPGRFNPIGTFVGALVLAVGANGLQLLGMDTWVSQVFSGTVLVIAVVLAALFGDLRKSVKS